MSRPTQPAQGQVPPDDGRNVPIHRRELDLARQARSTFDLVLPPGQNWTSPDVDLTTAASREVKYDAPPPSLTTSLTLWLHETDGMLISARQAKAYDLKMPGRAGMLERDNGQLYSWRRNVEPRLDWSTHHTGMCLCQSRPCFLARLECSLSTKALHSLPI